MVDDLMRPLRRIVVMPAYHAARTLEATVARLPAGLFDHVLVCDDASGDETAQLAAKLGLEVLRHPENRGYGGAQKTLYGRALELGAESIVMLHPDNQYDAERLTEVVAELERPGVDFVLGSRLADGRAAERGMPWWKRGSNRVLTTLQNQAFGTRFTDLHTGLRAYRRATLEQVPWRRFTDDFGFDAQMLAILHAKSLRGAEVAVGSWYLEHSSSVGLRASVKYGLQVVGSLAGFVRHKWSAP
jgi:glycosyltransferase involved in cell wall biosynthesis